MDADRIARYADELIRLSDAAALGEPPTDREPGFAVEDAYAVSAEVLRRREAAGWRVAGRKIGFTNRTIWPQYGVYQPIFGYMYDRTVRWAEDGGAALLDLSGLSQPLIEPEIAFRFRESPPLTDDPLALLRAVDWVGHGFEIVQCHFPGWKFRVADTIADGGLHGRYLVGGGIEVAGRDPEALAAQLATFRIVLSRDGEEVASGGGELVLGSPLNALAHLLGLLDSLPEHPPIQPGEIVTAGTLTDAMPVAPGETWSTRLEGLGVTGLTLRLSSDQK